MITEWQYGSLCGRQDYIKQLIKSNNYNTIDIGAAARFWSYPECKTAVDFYPINISDILYFQVNTENIESWKQVFDHVDYYGKFDFSICSHTMEDVFNPILLASVLEKISHRGFIAVPSKYNEFTKLFNNKYRGNAHHKQIFDVINNTIIVYPKFNWIETDDRSDIIVNTNKGDELTIIWEEKIPIKIFNDGIPFIGDESLINAYYEQLL